jgi:hypothetical protein
MLKSYEALNNLKEVRAEITRLNKAVGYTVFNPSAVAALEEVMAELEAEAALEMGEA